MYILINITYTKQPQGGTMVGVGLELSLHSYRSYIYRYIDI